MRPIVLLYNPRSVFYTLPLGLLAIGSALNPQDYDVRIIDGRLEADPVAAVLAQTDGALCLGVSVLTGAPIRDALAVSRAVKSRRPDLPVIWGGWHPSLFPAACLDEPSVDVTVQGQGERSLVEIVQRLSQGHGQDGLDGCLGCTHRHSDGSVRQNPPRPIADINELPAMDFSLIPVERYFALKGQRQLDFIASHGCFWRCDFCADPFVFGRRWVGLDPERLADTVAELWRRYRFDDMNFQDETFFTYAPRVEAIADALVAHDLPITWAATMRADQGERLADAVFAKLKRSGLRRVLVGVESGSQAMLDWMHKDIRLEQVIASAEKCLQHGIAAQFPFIVGFPGESEASVQATLDFAKRLRAMSPAFQTPFFYFKPYPGSTITEAAVRDGYALPRTLDEWAAFDIYDARGPWVSPERYRRVERFKFYQRLAWDEPPRAWKRPLQWMARWRCLHDVYALPVEQAVVDRLRPREALS
jgi:anaerobic magnesium-protoporphyrin IX monomethyl ester cyclase